MASGLNSKKEYDVPDLVEEDKDFVGQKVAVGLSDSGAVDYFEEFSPDSYSHGEDFYDEEPSTVATEETEELDDFVPLEPITGTYELGEQQEIVSTESLPMEAEFSDEPVLGGQGNLFLKPTVMNYPVLKSGSGPKLSIRYGK